jgi:hypothetical protein
MSQDDDLSQLANHLFYIFCRMEYALKAAGYNKGDGPAEANWQHKDFLAAVEYLIAKPSPELQTAIDFIFAAPPKKQVIVAGNIEWAVAEPANASLADKLLIYVRRVRNNLFHGGKFNGRWFEPERSEPLLRHSLTILSACVDGVVVRQNAKRHVFWPRDCCNCEWGGMSIRVCSESHEASQ